MKQEWVPSAHLRKGDRRVCRSERSQSPWCKGNGGTLGPSRRQSTLSPRSHSDCAFSTIPYPTNVINQAFVHASASACRVLVPHFKNGVQDFVLASLRYNAVVINLRPIVPAIAFSLGCSGSQLSMSATLRNAFNGATSSVLAPERTIPLRAPSSNRPSADARKVAS